jgi:hypothetical protein
LLLDISIAGAGNIQQWSLAIARRESADSAGIENQAMSTEHLDRTKTKRVPLAGQ